MLIRRRREGRLVGGGNGVIEYATLDDAFGSIARRLVRFKRTVQLLLVARFTVERNTEIDVLIVALMFRVSMNIKLLLHLMRNYPFHWKSGR